MPKYFEQKIANHYLYYTSHCFIEAIHTHASQRELREEGSAKFYIRKDGTSELMVRGDLTNKEIREIQEFIYDNYSTFHQLWADAFHDGNLEDVDYWNDPMSIEREKEKFKHNKRK